MTRKQKFVQKGGMHGTPLPSETFGIDSGSYHPTGASALDMTNSAWGANLPTSRGTIVADNLMGPDLGPTRHSGMQTGGARRNSRKNSNNRRRSLKNKNGGNNNNRRRSLKNQNGGNNNNRRRSLKNKNGGNNNNRRRSLKNKNRENTNNNRRHFEKNQNGGTPFQKITNPETGRSVSIQGSVGKKVLFNYLKH